MPSLVPPTETRFVTKSGVTVIVDNRPPSQPQPARRPEPPPPRAPTIVIRPPAPPTRQRDTLFAALFTEHGPFIRRMLLRRKDILPESAKDVQQRAFLILSDHIEKKGLPKNVRGFLIGVVRRDVANHKAAWRPDIDTEADGEAVSCGLPDPERAAQIAEQWETLMRYLQRLPADESDVFELVVLDGKTIAEAARELGRPLSTAAEQLGRARERLDAFSEASKRAAQLRERG